MKNFLLQRQWGWLASGIALGSVFLLAVLFVKPVGVSTQFVIADGIAWSSVDKSLIKKSSNKSGYSSKNAYLNKSGGKYAASIKNPLNYGFVFVLAMFGGGFMAHKLSAKNSKKPQQAAQQTSECWQYKGKQSAFKTYALAFLGGAIALFGARLAGGCTSGHMMSGMMQTSVSGYLFAISAFSTAILTAFLLYKKNKGAKK